MSTAITQYGEVDLEEIDHERQERAKERQAAKERQGKMQLQEGANVIRILPPRPGLKSPFYKLYVHYLRNPARPSESGRPVPCPLKNRGANCLVCKKVQELRRSGNPLDKELAKDLSAGRRIYANVIDKNNPDRGVQMLEFGVKIYDDLLAVMQDPAKDPSALGNITHPDTGHDVVIEKTVGNPQDRVRTTRYNVRPVPRPSQLPNKKWLSELHDLEKALSPMADDKIQAIMEGKDPDAEFPPPDDEAQPVGSVDDDLI